MPVRSASKPRSARPKASGRVIDWRSIAYNTLVSRALDDAEEATNRNRATVPREHVVLYQFSARGHDVAQSILGSLLDHPHDGVGAYYRSRPLLLSVGLSIEDVELPEWEAAADASPILIRSEAATEYRRALAERPGDLIPEVRERLEAGIRTSAVEYLDARRASDHFAFALRRLFARVDVLALPGRAQTAPKMDESGRLLEPLSPRNYTAPLNYPGVPALTFPCGFDAEGLPIGIQLAAPHWSEGTLLNVAHAYQQATDWHRRRPPLCA